MRMQHRCSINIEQYNVVEGVHTDGGNRATGRGQHFTDDCAWSGVHRGGRQLLLTSELLEGVFSACSLGQRATEWSGGASNHSTVRRSSGARRLGVITTILIRSAPNPFFYFLHI